MRRSSPSPTSILGRIDELSAELRRTRAKLKDLRVNDGETAAVVLRGAQLARERSMLERRLEAIRLSQVHNQGSKGETR